MTSENFHPFDKVGIQNVAGVPILTIQGAKPHNIHFQNQQGQQVGLITVENDQFVFTGNADEAARLFFDHALKPMVDAYIGERLLEFKAYLVYVQGYHLTQDEIAQIPHSTQTQRYWLETLATITQKARELLGLE